ncbi:MAG: sulfite exporter TauE/SafE family protein [Myxococcaceae bacterium]
MTPAALSLVLFATSFGAGLLGALTGLGGGVVIVPLLTLAFGVDLRYAIGASLVSVIATSSGAAAAFVKEGFSNIRLGMFLEIATTSGAIAGSVVALWVHPALIAVIFGVVLLFSAGLSLKPRRDLPREGPPDRIAHALRLDGAYPGPDGARVGYRVHHVPAGFALMAVAGVLSGLLGIGSGAIKVLALDEAMRLPFKVSTTTSNFMIGVTAAASAGIYLHRGYLDPLLVMPVMLGVLAGAMAGAWILVRARVRVLRWVFAAVIVALGVEMVWNGATGRI